MPSALATASNDVRQRRRPRSRSPTAAHPTLAAVPLAEVRRRERVVDEVLDVSPWRPLPSRRSRSARRRSAASATSAIVVLPSLSFFEQSSVERFERLGGRVEHAVARRRAQAAEAADVLARRVRRTRTSRRRGRDASGELDAPERPGIPITAPATPPTATAATTTPAATIRRPIILHPSALVGFTAPAPFDRAWQSPGIACGVRPRTPALLSEPTTGWPQIAGAIILT